MQSRSSSGRRGSTREGRAQIFREATAIVAADFSRDLTVEEVARRVASSPRQLRRVFAEVGGLSFRAYLERVRMRHARELLLSTDTPVKEIARRVGYRQASAFTKAFGREHGTTPSEFRDRSRGKGDAR